MSSINSVRNLQILFFIKKNEKIKNLKNREKKWPDIGIYTYYWSRWIVVHFLNFFMVTEILLWNRKKKIECSWVCTFQTM